ncbi:hypothetical protein PALB_9640 [Pseudoalteromonas luteoviolacea B = ATCC 29581]|nr:hypothetical protein PALB_9640 [Pseudoalteromonas luteoviolacea B = ATCC 29581]
MKLSHGLITLVFISNVAFANGLSNKVNEYFEAQKSVENKLSKESDVDKLLTLLTPDATFEHPRFNAVQSKEEYKKGLLYYLGKYGKCDIQVKNVIEGLNAVIVEYLHPCTDQGGASDTKENAQRLVTLFEFSGDKIKLIRHYY